jgi:ferric-dicitrate binding protein FerR (iron transport regulator)
MHDQAFDHDEAAAILAAMSERVESLDRIQRLRDENERLWQRARELETRRAEILRPIHEANAVQEARRERIRDALRLAACGGVAALAVTFSAFVARATFGSSAVGLISVGFVAVCCLVSARPQRSTASSGVVG